MQAKKRILVVDDDTNSIAIAEELLGGDYNLKTAATGEEALEIALDFIPDLILLDVIMPGIDGYEVCRQIRSNKTLQYTKIIMVSAKAMTTERLEGYKVGADDYIIKPFDEDELLAKVRVYLRLKSVEELDQLRRQFTSTVTHEMRTPMTIVKGIICNIKADMFGKIRGNIKDQLETADKHIDRLANILNNFFDISKIEAGKMKLELAQFPLCPAVSEVYDLLKPKAEQRKIELSMDLPVEEVLLNADREKVVKILINLIGNAIKFIHEGDHINIKLEKLNGSARIDIEDTGPGIQSKDIDEVFNRFVQVERHVGPGEHGTGLGLAVTKELVELHGGRIWVENRPDGGAVFWFEIPLSVDANAEESVLVGAGNDSNVND